MPQVTTKLNTAIFKAGKPCAFIDLPVNEIGKFQKQNHSLLFTMPNFKPCQAIEGNDKQKRLILHRPSNDDVLAKMKEVAATLGTQYEPNHEVEVDYSNFSMGDAIKALIKDDIETRRKKGEEVADLEENQYPAGFETIGDIAHLNFNERQFPFRYIVGQVMFDKCQGIRSVVCKLGQIEAQFRYYNLECIAGEKDSYETIHVEDKVRFKVDVSKVYWCSKLATERTRMIQNFLKDGQVLCDMFCGIGPLAVKSAVKKKGLRIVCNDLNPEGIHYCKQNIKMNKVGDRVTPFNMDAREFVRFHVAQSNLLGTDRESELEIPKESLKFDHCYMNLPVDAVEFLDAFKGLFKDANPQVWRKDPEDPSTLQLPLIHVYGFTFEKEREQALDYFVERIGKALGFPKFSKAHVECFHNIRDVSSTSHMYSTTFRLPMEVAMGDIYTEFEGEKKKQKV